MGISLDGLDDPQGFIDRMMRQDFVTFVARAFPYITGGGPLLANWHLDAIAYELERVREKRSLRLLVTLPPRNLKSIMISVAWVAWMLGRDPTLNFVCVSYSNELSGKLARDCRTIMQSPWYKRLFPKTLLSEKRSAAYDFETTAGGGRLATSISGTLTGRGGDIIIIDDPIKPDEADSETTRKSVNDWYTSTLSSRLNDKGTGAIILVMQRLHENDLAGTLLETGGWNHLTLPAIATEDAPIPLTRGRMHLRRVGDVLHAAREPLAVLDELKRSMGSVRFEAQYQQNPIPAVGNMILREWLKTYETPLVADAKGQIVQSWDTASKDGIHSDWSVCITARVRRSSIHVLDVFRQKLAFPALLRAVHARAELYRPKVLLIEDAASGMQLIQTLTQGRPRSVPMPIARKPEHDKQTRVASISAQIEAGMLHLPNQAHWLATFVHELLGFPNGRHDDQVDALAQLMIWAAARPVRRITIAPPWIYQNGERISGGWDSIRSFTVDD